MSAKIGDIVLYVDYDGNEYAALVTGHNSFRAGTLNLCVWNHDAADSVKRAISQGDQPGCWKRRPE